MTGAKGPERRAPRPEDLPRGGGTGGGAPECRGPRHPTKCPTTCRRSRRAASRRNETPTRHPRFSWRQGSGATPAGARVRPPWRSLPWVFGALRAGRPAAPTNTTRTRMARSTHGTHTHDGKGESGNDTRHDNDEVPTRATHTHAHHARTAGRQSRATKARCHRPGPSPRASARRAPVRRAPHPRPHPHHPLPHPRGSMGTTPRRASNSLPV